MIFKESVSTAGSSLSGGSIPSFGNSEENELSQHLAKLQSSIQLLVKEVL